MAIFYNKIHTKRGKDPHIQTHYRKYSQSRVFYKKKSHPQCVNIAIIIIHLLCGYKLAIIQRYTRNGIASKDNKPHKLS